MRIVFISLCSSHACSAVIPGRCGASNYGARLRPGESRDSGSGPLDHPGMTAAPSLPPAQQKHALLAEHIPDPPGQVQRHRAAVEIERDRALHLDVDLAAELDEILDGAEMDVRRV